MKKITIKQDSTENWSKAKNFIPKEGEILMYDEAKLKIGDGKTKINDLPFSTQKYKYIYLDDTLIIQQEEEEDLWQK